MSSSIISFLFRAEDGEFLLTYASLARFMDIQLFAVGIKNYVLEELQVNDLQKLICVLFIFLTLNNCSRWHYMLSCNLMCFTNSFDNAVKFTLKPTSLRLIDKMSGILMQ